MESNRIGIAISGGGTKLPFLAGIGIELFNRVTPDYVIGTSAGAILQIPLINNMKEVIEYKAKNFTLNDFFTYNPNTLIGKIRILLSILKGEINLLDQYKLKKTLKKIININDFNELLDSKTIPYIGTVDIEYGDRYYYNLKSYSYDTALDIILASSSIPVYTSPVKIEGKYMVDGGLRDHIGSAFLVENTNIDTLYSIYSRPDFFNYDKEKQFKVEKSKFGKIQIDKIFNRTIDILNNEISKNDEKETDNICKEKHIKQYKYFAPYILNKGVYNTNVEDNTKLFELGRKTKSIVV